MTPLPELGPRAEVTEAGKYAGSRPFTDVARRLLLIVAMVCAHTATFLGPAALVGGCVFPPPLEIGDPDAGPNSVPVIVSANSEFAFPGPLLFEEEEDRTITLTLVDDDVEDQLFVKLYVDWFPDGGETPSVVECTVQQSVDSTTRTADCPTESICRVVDDTASHYLEAVVADRPFLNMGDPEFRALPEGAASSARGWTMRCPQEDM